MKRSDWLRNKQPAGPEPKVSKKKTPWPKDDPTKDSDGWDLTWPGPSAAERRVQREEEARQRARRINISDPLGLTESIEMDAAGWRARYEAAQERAERSRQQAENMANTEGPFDRPNSPTMRERSRAWSEADLNPVDVPTDPDRTWLSEPVRPERIVRRRQWI